jgi:hypothetical protein
MAMATATTLRSTKENAAVSHSASTICRRRAVMDDSDALLCLICQESMLERPAEPDRGGTVTRACANGHLFHTHCIDHWRARNGPATTCPKCRGALIYTPAPAPDPAPAPAPRFANLERMMAAANGSDWANGANGSDWANGANGANGADGAVESSGTNLALYAAAWDVEKRDAAVKAPAQTHAPLASSGASVGAPGARHVLLEDDVSMDELRARACSDADLAAYALTWRDALALGLRRDHFTSGWLALARVPVLFRDARWEDLRALGVSLDDAMGAGAQLTAHTLGRLGASAASLRRAGELTRERFVALPFTLDEWSAELRLERADLVALTLRRADYVALFAASRRDWSARRMRDELGFSDAELSSASVVPSYEDIELDL